MKYSIGDTIKLKPLNQLLNLASRMENFSFEKGIIKGGGFVIGAGMLKRGSATILHTDITNIYDYLCNDNSYYSDWMLE